MLKAFEVAGYSPVSVEQQFGGLSRAFRMGAPPHGGIAPGIDRILMLLADVSNFREVIAFPFNQRGEDPMLGAPGGVSPAQLRDVHVQVRAGA